MNDDQSFYEIQLNTPHLVLAFLGAAVVGVALFWLGVIIGRGQSATAGPSDWQAAAPISESQDEGADDPAEFFQEADDPTATVPADEDPTAGEAAANEPETTTQEEEAPPATEETAAEAEPPAQAESFQPAEPVAADPAPVAAASESGLPQADPSLNSGWVIQVRSTPDEAAANQLQERLASAGFPAFVISAEVDGTTYYRVRVGRYASRPDADRVEAALVERPDIEDAWVTQG